MEYRADQTCKYIYDSDRVADFEVLNQGSDCMHLDLKVQGLELFRS